MRRAARRRTPTRSPAEQSTVPVATVALAAATGLAALGLAAVAVTTVLAETAAAPAAGPGWTLGLVALLGYQGASDEDDRIAALRAKTDALLAGETDVDFATEEDGDLGALAANLDRLADELAAAEDAPDGQGGRSSDDADERAGDDTAGRSRGDHGRTLQRLLEVGADRDATFEERVRRILDLGRERLDTEGAFLSRIDAAADEFEFLVTSGDVEGIEPGTVAPYGETYCRRVVEAEDVYEVVEAEDVYEVVDAEAEGWLDDPAYRRWGLGSYVGAYLTVDDAVVGTVAFVSEAPADRPLTDDERTFVSLAAKWASHQLERRDHARDLEEYREFTDTVLDAVDDVFYILDEDGRFVDWNESFAAVAGYSDEALAEMHATELFPAEYQGAVSRAIRAVFETGDGVVEAPFETASGECVPHEFIATRVENPDGEPRLVGIGRDITDRMTRERELERTRELLEQSQRMANVGAWELVVDEDGDHDVELTDEAYRILGIDPSESASFADGLSVTHPADRVRVQAAVERALQDGVPYDIEARIVTDDGTEKWVRTLGEPVVEDGEVVRLRGSIQDITERREREAALREREQQYRHLAERVDEAFYSLATDWTVTYWNDVIAERTGITAEEAVGADFWALFPAAEDMTFGRKLHEAMASTETMTFETYYEPYDTWLYVRCYPAENGLSIFSEDVTDRKEREQELEYTRELLEQTQRLASVGGWELDVTGTPPYDGRLTDEARRIYGVDPDEPMDGARAMRYYRPEDRPRVHRAVERAVEHGESAALEVRVQRADGECWVRLGIEPVREDGTVVKLRGAIQDVTARKRHELALESLHEGTRGLLYAESPEAVADVTMEVANDILDVAGAALYRFEGDADRFVAAGFTPGYVDVCDGTPPLPAGDEDSPVWRAFVDGETVVTRDEPPCSPATTAGATGGLCVPVGDHSVFVVLVDDPDGPEDRTQRLVETLVATTEAAYGRLESEQSLRERDEQLQAQNERLQRQIHVTDIIRTVNRSLVDASSRGAIQTAVCERLAASDLVAFAWIGRLDPEDGTVAVEESAGEGDRYLDAFAHTGTAGEPARLTTASGEPTVVENVVDRLRSEPWRQKAYEHGFGSVVSVPVVHDDYTYSVLTVYGASANAFGELEGAVFAELGETVGNAINAVQTRAALYADTSTELRLELADEDLLLQQVAAGADAEVSLQGVSTGQDGETRLFFAVENGDPDAVAAVLDGLVSVADHRLIAETESGGQFEATVPGESLVSRLLDHGASLRDLTVAPDRLTAVVDVSRETEVRQFVELLQERYPSTSLVARREVERSVGTKAELAEGILGDLTDRQREALATAHYAGYFEWPRDASGQDVAAMLDLSQPTVNRHLRLAQGTLVDHLFDEWPGGDGSLADAAADDDGVSDDA